jgi:hypothetical protein
MDLRIQNRELIHELQSDGILPGDPKKREISQAVVRRFMHLKHRVDEVRDSPQPIEKRSVQRAYRSLREVGKLLVDEALHRLAPEKLAKTILSKIIHGKIDTRDLHLFLPTTLHVLKQVQNHLPRKEQAAAHEKLSTQHIKQAMQLAIGGWETETDRQTQLVLAEFLKR